MPGTPHAEASAVPATLHESNPPRATPPAAHSAPAPVIKQYDCRNQRKRRPFRYRHPDPISKNGYSGISAGHTRNKNHFGRRMRADLRLPARMRLLHLRQRRWRPLLQPLRHASALFRKPRRNKLQLRKRQRHPCRHFKTAQTEPASLLRQPSSFPAAPAPVTRPQPPHKPPALTPAPSAARTSTPEKPPAQ